MVNSILFACNMNSVRSPMAEAVARHLLGDEMEVSSCGVYKGAPDPFVLKALEDAGMAAPGHEPREFSECDTDDFDLVIALTPEAAAEARKTHSNVDYWDVENPTDTRGTEEELRSAYARLRDQLRSLILTHFGDDVARPH